MIQVKRVFCRASHGALVGLSVTIGQGITALLGGPEDGARTLLGLLARHGRASQGEIQLDDKPIESFAASKLAYVPLDAKLPLGLTVAEFLTTAARVRGEPPLSAASALDTLGVPHLAGRRMKTLRVDEARAVALAEALASRTVRTILIEEPLARLDAAAERLAVRALRARAREGVLVVFWTTSTVVAHKIADAVFVVGAGRIATGPSPTSTQLTAGPLGTHLEITSPDARSLAHALVTRDGVDALETEGHRLRVRGKSLGDVAQAVADAVRESGANLVAMRAVPISLEAALVSQRAELSAVARVAYERARSHAWAMHAAAPGIVRGPEPGEERPPAPTDPRAPGGGTA